MPPDDNSGRRPPVGDTPDPRRRTDRGAALPPELDPRGRRAAGSTRAGGRRRRRPDLAVGAAVGVRTLAALVSLAVLVGSGWAWATYRNFTSNIVRVQAFTAKTKPAKDLDGSDQNILIAGNDDRQSATDAELAQLGTTRDGGSLNTDTMMLLHIPADGKKASAISFPRDTYVNIPGHGMDRLNAAYADGVQDGKGNRSQGAQLLVRSIENLTGLTVDHFVQVDLLGFYRISNAIGGITVCLNAAQNAQTENDDPSDPHPNGYSGINLKKGTNVIKGTQALAFVRQRHGLPRGDLDRIVRQQYFLSAAFRKIVSAGTLINPITLNNLLKAVSSSLQMDGDSAGHKGLQPQELATQMSDLTAGNLTFTTIPTSDETIDGNAVQAVNPDTLPTFINHVLGMSTSSALSQAKPVAPSTVRVSVLNGTGQSGYAGTNAAALAKAGFKTSTGDGSTAATTTIRYPGGMESQAKTLARYVPGASLVQSAQVQSVTLLLGGDGKQARSTLATSRPAPPAPAKPADSRNAAQAGCIN